MYIKLDVRRDLAKPYMGVGGRVITVADKAYPVGLCGLPFGGRPVCAQTKSPVMSRAFAYFSLA